MLPADQLGSDNVKNLRDALKVRACFPPEHADRGSSTLHTMCTAGSHVLTLRHAACHGWHRLPAASRRSN